MVSDIPFWPFYQGQERERGVEKGAHILEAHSETCQISKVACFAKIVNGF